MARYIDIEAVGIGKAKREAFLVSKYADGWNNAIEIFENEPAADVVEVEKVAEMLRLIFEDDCACNYNGNDGWLPRKCKYAPDECPMPKERLGCWKEFVKHFLAKMDGKG